MNPILYHFGTLLGIVDTIPQTIRVGRQDILNFRRFDAMMDVIVTYQKFRQAQARLEALWRL